MKGAGMDVLMKKSNLALLLAALAVLGFGAGFVTCGLVIQHRVKQLTAVPADLPAKMAARVAEDLGLSEEQEGQVRDAFAAHGAKMEARRDAWRAEMDGYVRELNAKIEDFLTEEQKPKHREMCEKMLRRMETDRKLRGAARAAEREKARAQEGEGK